MKIALVSDVHANLHALDAVLDHMGSVGADQIYSLGDVVGYNAFPSECTRLLREKASVSILGNHDWAATKGSPDGFNIAAKAAIDFTRRHLDEEDVKYLSSLAPNATIDQPGFILDLFHGSIADPLWQYVFPSAAPGVFREIADELPPTRRRVVVLGHTHVPMALSSHALSAEDLGDFHTGVPVEKLDAGRREQLLLVNPGSVGQPRDGDPRASYAILDSESARVTFHRVKYDVSAAARAIREAGLPGVLAERLSIGR